MIAGIDAMRPETRARVLELSADLRRTRFASNVVAVVVCGSAARNEDLAGRDDARSDIDLMIVTNSASLLLGRAIHRFLETWSDHGIEGSRVPLATLARHRTIINYEARQNGVVVDGDPAVLTRIPLQFPEDIPPFEGSRLLLNRLYEHVKLAAGMTTASRCTQKTYEAIGEAELVIGCRYRPSFRARLQEVRTRPLADAELHQRYVHALEARLAGGLPDSDSESARTHLVRALQRQLQRLTHCEGSVDEQLQALGKVLRHPSHRLYWLALTSTHGRPQLGSLREDPAVLIWRKAAYFLAHPAKEAPAALVRAWQRCPQPLDGGSDRL